MIYLPVYRTKSCAVLGASTPGMPGPFGSWHSETDDDHPEEVPVLDIGGSAG